MNQRSYKQLKTFEKYSIKNNGSFKKNNINDYMKHKLNNAKSTINNLNLKSKMKGETSENRNNSIKNFSLKSKLMRFLTNKENLKNVNKKNKNYQNIFLEKNENETILQTAYNQNNLLEESTTNNEDSRNKEYIKVSKDNNQIRNSDVLIKNKIFIILT